MTTRIRERDGAVADAVRRMYAAYPHSDQFDRHLHPDITIWESDQPGPWIGLPELTALRDRRRASTGEAAAAGARLWVERLLVDRWPDRVAVARYVLHADTPGGQMSFRVTDVLERQADVSDSEDWRVVHHHAEQL